jgi:hypothetical protein
MILKIQVRSESHFLHVEKTKNNSRSNKQNASRDYKGRIHSKEVATLNQVHFVGCQLKLLSLLRFCQQLTSTEVGCIAEPVVDKNQ